MDPLVVAGATPVVIGRGVLDSVSVLGGAEPPMVAVITSPAVSAIADTVAGNISGAGRPVARVVVPDGEAAKNLDTVESVVRALNESAMTRDGLIVGVGGGSITDLAGFVAAIYLRGVRVHYVTTTLLGAVDASIGGKTGVNAGGKNLIGVFRHPDRVIIDIDVLDRLAPEHRREGAAEALKAGFIADPGLVELFEREGLDADLETVVRSALAVKSAVVARDFEESGERAILNYGHTVGHAVEIATGMSHGESVGVGMVAAGVVGSRLVGFAERRRHDEIIARLGLPVSVAGADPGAIEALMALDKKRDRSGVRMVLLEAIGHPVVVGVDAATVRAALEAVGIRRTP